MKSVLAVAVIVGFLVAAGNGASEQSLVTLSFSQYRNVNGVLVSVFRGTISSGAAGETVDLLVQDCGARGSRIAGGTQTRAGGGWEIQNPEATPPWRSWPFYSGSTFRARWHGQLSEPVEYRLAAPVFARKVPGKHSWRVHVSDPAASTMKMAGKTVELQRRVGQRWIRYQRARLVHKASFTLGPYNNEAVFEVPRRGLRLRGFLPRASALPCYLPAATEPWRS
jgi:hypothetical protein